MKNIVTSQPPVPVTSNINGSNVKTYNLTSDAATYSVTSNVQPYDLTSNGVNRGGGERKADFAIKEHM